MLSNLAITVFQLRFYRDQKQLIKRDCEVVLFYIGALFTPNGIIGHQKNIFTQKGSKVGNEASQIGRFAAIETSAPFEVRSH